MADKLLYAVQDYRKKRVIIDTDGARQMTRLQSHIHRRRPKDKSLHIDKFTVYHRRFHM